MRRRVGVSRLPDLAAQQRAAGVPPKQLVGAWVEVEGVGPGLVVAFQPVINRIVYGGSGQRKTPSVAREAKSTSSAAPS